MGITPEGFTRRYDTRFRFGNTTPKNRQECLLRVSVPQWWVYDIWLAIEVAMFTGIV